MSRKAAPSAPVVASLRIRFKKLRDGSHNFSCERSDGTQTWQRQPNISILHDLTHYAVETTLGHRRGFYGMVAEGWNLTDFGAPWPRGPLPADADPSELIVGFFDVERTMEEPFSAQDFNASMASYYLQHLGRDAGWEISEPQLSGIRARLIVLFEQWRQLAPGDTLELDFESPRAFSP
ncbi:MAG: hypothetical protein ABI877_10835 [Gemmatimonadaceae bacterium]